MYYCIYVHEVCIFNCGYDACIRFYRVILLCSYHPLHSIRRFIVYLTCIHIVLMLKYITCFASYICVCSMCKCIVACVPCVHVFPPFSHMSPCSCGTHPIDTGNICNLFRSPYTCSCFPIYVLLPFSSRRCLPSPPGTWAFPCAITSSLPLSLMHIF